MLIQMTLAGLAPGMLQHRFGEAEAQKATSGRGKTAAPQDEKTPREEAEGFLYLVDGKPVIPETWLLRSWQEAGRDYKIGKRQVSTARASIVPAAVMISTKAIFITPMKWEVDTRPVTIPATQGKILRHRPRFEEWKVTVDVGLDTDMISETMFRSMVDDSGKKIGIGDFRPQRGGPFGRYRVEKWTSKKPKK